MTCWQLEEHNRRCRNRAGPIPEHLKDLPQGTKGGAYPTCAKKGNRRTFCGVRWPSRSASLGNVRDPHRKTRMGSVT